MDINEVLYELRVKRKLSQERVAEIIGVDYSTYAKYESGTSSLRYNHVVKLAEYYGLTLDELQHYGDDSFSLEPSLQLEKKKTLTVLVELDGEKKTVDWWIDKLKKINTTIGSLG